MAENPNDLQDYFSGLSEVEQQNISANDKEDLNVSNGVPSDDEGIDDFAKSVVNIIIEDGRPPLPNFFELFFDKLLQEKPLEFQKEINKLIEDNDDSSINSRAIFERNLKKGFSYIQDILKLTAIMYKNISVMNSALEKKSLELSSLGGNPLSKKILTSVISDMKKFSDIMDKQLKRVKKSYENSSGIAKILKNDSIYDSVFDVFNKSYMTGLIKKELQNMKKFNHLSVIIVLSLNRKSNNVCQNPKIKMMMRRTFSNLLLKTSRRNDIIGHYGEGIFYMLLKQSDIEASKRTCDRMHSLFSNSNIFAQGREIPIGVCFGILPLDVEINYDTHDKNMINVLRAAYNKPKQKYIVFDEDLLDDAQDDIAEENVQEDEDKT